MDVVEEDVVGGFVDAVVDVDWGYAAAVGVEDMEDVEDVEGVGDVEPHKHHWVSALVIVCGLPGCTLDDVCCGNESLLCYVSCGDDLIWSLHWCPMSCSHQTRYHSHCRKSQTSQSLNYHHDTSVSEACSLATFGAACSFR